MRISINAWSMVRHATGRFLIRRMPTGIVPFIPSSLGRFGTAVIRKKKRSPSLSRPLLFLKTQASLLLPPNPQSGIWKTVVYDLSMGFTFLLHCLLCCINILETKNIWNGWKPVTGTHQKFYMMRMRGCSTEILHLKRE